MPEVRWKIVGHKSGDAFFEHSLPYGALTEGQAAELLGRLASHHLTATEVVKASLKRGAANRTGHLEVRRMSSAQFGLMTDGNPYYTATLEEV